MVTKSARETSAALAEVILRMRVAETRRVLRADFIWNPFVSSCKQLPTLRKTVQIEFVRLYFEKYITH